MKIQWINDKQKVEEFYFTKIQSKIAKWIMWLQNLHKQVEAKTNWYISHHCTLMLLYNILFDCDCWWIRSHGMHLVCNQVLAQLIYFHRYFILETTLKSHIMANVCYCIIITKDISHIMATVYVIYHNDQGYKPHHGNCLCYSILVQITPFRIKQDHLGSECQMFKTTLVVRFSNTLTDISKPDCVNNKWCIFSF